MQSNTIVGNKCGSWEVIAPAGKVRKSLLWLCRCECGFEKNLTTSLLNSGYTKECKGCISRRRQKANDDLEEKYVGKRYGSYTIIRLENNAPSGGRQWLCRCVCGYERLFFTSNLFGNGKRKATVCQQCSLRTMELANRTTDSIPHRFWKRFCDSAKRRNIRVDVSQSQAYDLFVRQEKRCALSGEPLYFTLLRTNYNRYTTASLDRIDSEKGYEMGNIQWVHKNINMMKQCFSQNEFINMCRQVAGHTAAAPRSNI